MEYIVEINAPPVLCMAFKARVFTMKGFFLYTFPKKGLDVYHATGDFSSHHL